MGLLDHFLQPQERMAGQGLLAQMFSQGDRAKRFLSELLRDPAGSMERAGGQIQDNHRTLDGLTDRAMAGDKKAQGDAAQMALNSLMGFAPAGMTAWHGSPHIFNKFDSSKIGTGEGAQAYGHGLYLAESPAVAKQYADTLSDAAKLTPEGRAARALAGANGDVMEAKRALYREYNSAGSGPYADAAWNAVQALERGGVKAPNLYRVDLPDSAVSRMLDYDAPVPQGQWKPLSNAAMRDFGSGATNTSGEKLYKEAVFNFKTAGHPNPTQAATEWLRQQGVPGMKYLDGGSRATGQGSSNFVVFPGEENLLTILERNGVPLR